MPLQDAAVECHPEDATVGKSPVLPHTRRVSPTGFSVGILRTEVLEESHTVTNDLAP